MVSCATMTGSPLCVPQNPFGGSICSSVRRSCSSVLMPPLATAVRTCRAFRHIPSHCSSVRTPQSCIGEPAIRLDSAPPYRRCRGRCFVRWLESWGTSNSGTSLRAPRPRCTSTREPNGTATFCHTDISAARHARSACRRSDPRSIRSSRSWRPKRWCTC